GQRGRPVAGAVPVGSQHRVAARHDVRDGSREAERSHPVRQPVAVPADVRAVRGKRRDAGDPELFEEVLLSLRPALAGQRQRAFEGHGKKTYTGKKQAAWWSSTRTASSGGSSSAQRCWALKQRVRKRQPEGGLRG